MNTFNKFVWVEREDIDIRGEWLKILKNEGQRILCERKSPFHADVYIDSTDVKQLTTKEIF